MSDNNPLGLWSLEDNYGTQSLLPLPISIVPVQIIILLHQQSVTIIIFQSPPHTHLSIYMLLPGKSPGVQLYFSHNAPQKTYMAPCNLLG